MAKIITTEQVVLQKRILRNRLSTKRIRNGITSLDTCLQVSATTNAVTVHLGSAYIEGSVFSIENDVTDYYILPLSSSETKAYRVVIRKEKEAGATESAIGLYLKEGTESAVPTLDRFNDNTREVYELSLAAVFKSEDGIIVVDERFDTSVCGLSELEVDGNELMDMMYPIGSIYMTANPINPENLFGGTWERWGKGQVPVAIDEEDADFATPDKEGGDKYLSGDIGLAGINYGGITGGGAYASRVLTTSTFVTNNGNQYNSLRNFSSSAANNLQPYITCYMFKRIA